MLKSSSRDVLSIDSDSLTFLRFGSAKKQTPLLQTRTLRMPQAFTDAQVSPQLTNAAALSDALKRLRNDSGSLDQVSLLLPDSWFRMNLVELSELPDRREEAEETIRWAIKRSLPIAPELLRLSWLVVGRTESKRRLLVLSALAKTLSDIESALEANKIWATTIEPMGLNIWNAIASAVPASKSDRLLLHVRPHEFTTALFRGEEPIFLRSRNLRGDRSVAQEIRVSASYLRETMGGNPIEQCYVVGSDASAELISVLGEAFSAPVKRLHSNDFVQAAPGIETAALESEVIASTGVFTA